MPLNTGYSGTRGERDTRKRLAPAETGLVSISTEDGMQIDESNEEDLTVDSSGRETRLNTDNSIPKSFKPGSNATVESSNRPAKWHSGITSTDDGINANA
jgi:hypothetical protein